MFSGRICIPDALVTNVILGVHISARHCATLSLGVYDMCGTTRYRAGKKSKYLALFWQRFMYFAIKFMCLNMFIHKKYNVLSEAEFFVGLQFKIVVFSIGTFLSGSHIRVIISITTQNALLGNIRCRQSVILVFSFYKMVINVAYV